MYVYMYICCIYVYVVCRGVFGIVSSQGWSLCPIDFRADCFFFTREGKGGGGCNFTSLQKVESGTLSIRLNTREFIPILSFLYVSGTSAVCHVSIAFHGSFYSGCRGRGGGNSVARNFPSLLHVSFFLSFLFYKKLRL